MKINKLIWILITFLFLTCKIEKEGESDQNLSGDDVLEYSNEEFSVKIKEKTLSINTANVIKLPVNLPKDIYVYKSAIIKKVDIGTDKYTIRMLLSDRSRIVIDSCNNHMKANGWKKASEKKTDDKIVLLFTKDSRHTEFSITPEKKRTWMDIETNR